MRDYGVIQGDGTINGWPKGTNRFYEYRDLTCAQAEAAFRAKVLALYQAGKTADILGFTTVTIPTATAGFGWQARNCSVVPAPSTTNPVTGITCLETGGQTVLTVTAAANTLTEVNIMAVSGGAQWGESQTWYPTTNGQKVFTFPFLAGVYHVSGRKVGVTDSGQYVSVEYIKSSTNNVTPQPSTPVAVQDSFVVVFPPPNPDYLSVTRKPYNTQTGLWGITVDSAASPASLNYPARQWRYLLGGVWMTKDEINAASLEPFHRYVVVAALVDLTLDESQWRNQPTPVTQTTIYLS